MRCKWGSSCHSIFFCSGKEMNPASIAKQKRVAQRRRSRVLTIPVSHVGAMFDLRQKFRRLPHKFRVVHKGKAYEFTRNANNNSYHMAQNEQGEHPVSFQLQCNGTRTSACINKLYWNNRREPSTQPAARAIIEALKSIANSVNVLDASFVPEYKGIGLVPRYLTNLPNLYENFDMDPRQQTSAERRKLANLIGARAAGQRVTVNASLRRLLTPDGVAALEAGVPLKMIHWIPNGTVPPHRPIRTWSRTNANRA